MLVGDLSKLWDEIKDAECIRILGCPGSGKTIVLVILLKEYLKSKDKSKTPLFIYGDDSLQSIGRLFQELEIHEEVLITRSSLVVDNLQDYRIFSNEPGKVILKNGEVINTPQIYCDQLPESCWIDSQTDDPVTAYEDFVNKGDIRVKNETNLLVTRLSGSREFYVALGVRNHAKAAFCIKRVVNDFHHLTQGQLAVLSMHDKYTYDTCRRNWKSKSFIYHYGSSCDGIPKSEGQVYLENQSEKLYEQFCRTYEGFNNL